MSKGKNKTAFILVAYLDKSGVFKFVLSSQLPYTFSLSYDYRFPVFPQIRFFLKETFSNLGYSEGDFEIHESFRESFHMKGPTSSAKLYFVSCCKFLSFDSSFSQFFFPELLQKLPKNRERLLFLKAFQLLSDDKFHLIRAKEVSRKELREEKLI